MAEPADWIWISEADVVSTLDMGDAIAAIREAFAGEARGTAQNMVKTFASWGDGSTLHAIGATFSEAGFVGTKTWAHTPGGASPLLILFRTDGAIAAILEAFSLGQLRTGAVSGVATDLLAAPEASDLAMIGTGKQALAQVAAVLAVRPIQRVRVFGRDVTRREAFATRVEEVLHVAAVPSPSVAAAVEDADVVTLATRATEPFLASGMVAQGAHVNALGAITPSRQEFDPDLLGRCGVIATDSVPQARELSREFNLYFGDDDDRWSSLRSLGELLAGTAGRPAGVDVTLSKAMGTGICDLAVGLACYRAMRRNGLGEPREQPRGVPPRLRWGGDPGSGIGYV